MKLYAVQTSISRTAGGLFFSVRNLLIQISQKEGDKCDVCALGVTDHYSDQDKEAWTGVKVQTFTGFAGKLGLSFSLLRFAARNFKSGDVVYLNGIWTFVSLAARIAQWKKVAVVIAPRGMLDEWIIKKNKIPKRIYHHFFENALLSRASFVHALTEKEAESIRHLVPDANVVVCPNGIPIPERFAAPVPRTKKVFLYIGRLDNKKGLLELVESTNLLQEELRDQWILKIHGWGSLEYGNDLRESAARAKYSSNIEIGPAVYGPNKEAALTDADFFILPSKSEGLPMAAIEALAAGRPAIITAECNFDEEVMQSDACLVLGPRSQWSSVLTGAIRMDHQEIEHRSIEARRIAETKFDIQKIAPRMLQLFRETALVPSCD
ncbi:glycosyltransferase [Bradyrhizobium sp. 174]|uniref:glycosyltransferase n=1 Tax=Bradyrhizobium sp. 174 TaxID=2782645 RepID=UPI001FF7C460|nr:glycosyltransferase [Bradyrhizobium sp. 174]MCK1573656.1 glycosyltransferase [Bradyrhizobium sp. 174]